MWKWKKKITANNTKWTKAAQATLAYYWNLEFTESCWLGRDQTKKKELKFLLNLVSRFSHFPTLPDEDEGPWEQGWFLLSFACQKSDHSYRYGSYSSYRYNPDFLLKFWVIVISTFINSPFSFDLSPRGRRSFSKARERNDHIFCSLQARWFARSLVRSPRLENGKKTSAMQVYLTPHSMIVKESWKSQLLFFNSRLLIHVDSRWFSAWDT